MNTEKFNEIVKQTLVQPTQADQFEALVEALHGNSKVAIKPLIELCQEIGKQFGLDLVELCQDTLCNKAKEYAMNGDRLWNFKQNYVWQRSYDSVSRLFGYLEKHLCSCMDILTGRLEPNQAIVKEKFGDVVNYLCLLSALLQEESDAK